MRVRKEDGAKRERETMKMEGKKEGESRKETGRWAIVGKE